MSTHELRPLAPLQTLYKTQTPALSFRATSKHEWEVWKTRLRKELVTLLGGFPEERIPLDVEVVERKSFPGYTREKVIYQSAPEVSVPAYVLIPDGLSGPTPAVVALHGHGYGKNDIVGIWEDGEDRGIPDGYHKDFAVELVKRGFITVAPEQACFGERRQPEDLHSAPGRSSCARVAFYAMMLGKTALGIRVWDVMRTVDYLQTRPEVDPNRIGCMGISGGGMSTLFSSALEERIGAVVVSGYLNTFRDSIMAMDHCSCNYVPGLLKYAEMYDIAALIAPRPLLAESGTKDTIFPIEATKFSLRQVQRAYDLLGVPERLDADIFEGRHQISGAKAYDWLKEWLQDSTD
jgi:dienelactone hydrolase